MIILHSLRVLLFIEDNRVVLVRMIILWIILWIIR